MAKEVTCPPCKDVIRGENDSELVANVRQHMRARHRLPIWLSKIVRTDKRILRDARQVA
jgi:predicted small metal-binding protein